MSGRKFTGFIQNLLLYETSEYVPGHQRHLGEANKTNLKDPPFDEVSTPLRIQLLILPVQRIFFFSFDSIEKSFISQRKQMKIEEKGLWFTPLTGLLICTFEGAQSGRIRN